MGNKSNEEDDECNNLVVKTEILSDSEEGEYTIEEVDVDHLKVEIKEENGGFDERYEKEGKSVKKMY